MGIKVNDNSKVVVKHEVKEGDILVISDRNDKNKFFRLIVKNNGKYLFVNLESGTIGLERNSIESAINFYKEDYEEVYVVKDADITFDERQIV